MKNLSNSLFKPLLIALLIIFSFKSIAQGSDELKPSQFKFNLDLFGVIASHEARLSNKFTLVSGLGISSGGSADISRYDFNNSWKVYNFWANLQGRFYYNLAQRAQRNKKTGNNSGNFFSFSGTYGFKPFTSTELTTTADVYVNGVFVGQATAPIKEYSSITFGPNWGIQRRLGRNFSWETTLGASLNYLDDSNEWSLAPAVTLRLGYVIK